jgi:NAD-dependent dihydropyrimidine dehydrogenase PreA subunit/flavodoxin
MKGLVVYYSQTGNTRKIAQAIHAGMRQVIKCDIAALKETNPQALIKYDLIGLGSPTWGGVPPNFAAFIEGMVSLEGKHVFPFFTHGSLPAGYMHTMIPALKRKGLIVIGFNDWYGNSIQQFIPYPHFIAGHPDDIDLREAEDFGREMAQRSQRIYSGETQHIPKPPTRRELDKRYGRPLPLPKEAAEAEDMLLKQRKINMEKCTVCGLCVDNCPTGSIDFSASPPVFRDSCARCWFCEQICPEGAIEVNWEPFAKLHDKLIGNLIKSLEKAEAQGRFRRLVPLENIGWNTHWYQISGHPRYVIK